MGFPIRRSTGRRLFAPHRSLSQRTTSFIASCRQGIHRMLLGRLIALISNAHPLERNAARLAPSIVLARLGQTPPRKTSLHRDRPAPSLRLASSSRQIPARADALLYPATAADRGVRRLGHIPSSRCQAARRVSAAEAELFDVGHPFTRASPAGRVASRGLKSGGARRDRTDDLLLAKQALSQLSYGPDSTR